MRIGIDCRLWDETGVGRYTRNLVKYLQVLDNKNEYVLFVTDNFNEDGRWKMEDGRWKIVRADIRWHSVEEQIKFPKILNKENLDLMHFPYFSVPVFYNKPFVVTIHDLILHNFPTGEASTLPAPLYKAKLLGYKFIINRAVKKAKKIIVPTNAVKEEMIQRLKVPVSKIEITYEGVDEKISNFKYPISNFKLNKNKYFLYVGNAYPHKNLNRLIEAFQKLRSDAKYENIDLVLVGRKDYFYKRLEDYLKKNNLNNIKIVYDANDSLIAYFYKNAIALVVPSLMEGFSLSTIEAMSNKCLVLVSDIPVHREICRDTAIYFNPKNELEIVERMKDVCLNDFSKIKERGFERSKQFSWEKMTKETLEIYESCTGLRQN